MRPAEHHDGVLRKRGLLAPSNGHRLHHQDETVRHRGVALAAVYESPGIAGDAGDANGAAATNDGIISTLRDTLFYGALTVGFLSLGFWILFQGERGGEAGSGQRTIVAGITWSVCWALFVAALLVNQHWWTVTKATDTGISQINSQLANAML